MKRSILWLAGPLVLGVLIAVLVLAVPAQAGPLAQAPDPAASYPQPGAEAFGVVESFPEGLLGSWAVDGTIYTATAQTHFWMWGSPFYVGACVKVSYDPNTYNAYDIGLLPTDRCGQSENARQYFIGLIEQVPVGYPSIVDHTPGISGTWVISGTSFVSTPQTRLNTRNGPLAVGACATVKYRLVNGVNMADEIRNEKIYRCYQTRDFNQAYGTVVTFPEDLNGAWVISDTTGMSLTFMTTPSSRVFTHHYPLEAGACIRVKYFNDMDVNIASNVQTVNARLCEGHFNDFQPLSKLYALVDSMPPTTTITSTWMLAGVNFSSTQQTRVEEEEGPLAVGNCAEAKYDPTGGAMLIHKLEGEEPSDCQARDGSDLFKLYGVVEMMPTAGYTGTWQVSGVSFTVNPSTTVESRHGEFLIGAYVKVYFSYDVASGERTAQVLKTHVGPGYGHMNHRGHFDGWIHDPSGDKITVDGTTYELDPDADVPSGLQQGEMVWINLYQDPDGTFVTQVSQDQTVFLPAIRN